MTSGDSGELLEQDFLAECVEGQVSLDVGANGLNQLFEEGSFPVLLRIVLVLVQAIL